MEILSLKNQPLRNRKKILFIHHGSILGGAPTSLANTIIGLKKYSDYEIKILCCHSAMKSFFKEKTGIEAADIYSPFLILGRIMIGYASILNLKNLYLLIRELLILPISVYRQVMSFKHEAPSIVHLNSSILIITAVCAKFAGIPLAWHVREVLAGGRFNARKIFMGWIIRKLADRVIAISPVEAAALGNDRKGNIQVIYNFIDFNRFDSTLVNISEAKKNFTVNQDDQIVLSLGGASFRKGTYQIICAAKKLHLKCKFLLAGPKLQSKDRNKIMSSLISLLLKVEDILYAIHFKTYHSWFYEDRLSNEMRSISDDRIRFIGHVDDVVALIAISDILVFAGTTPHFPRPVYEAWAMKKPVIVFDLEGVSQNISKNQDGIIVQKNTGAELAKELKMILNDKELRQKLGENGYQKSKDRFDMDKNIFKIIKTYNIIINQHKI